MKTLRAGVSRLREELAALLGADVGEVAGPKKGSEPDVPTAPVLIGTEAVLHRVRRASAVAFLDIDLHLLAPRLSATEDTLALFVRAGRLVGGRAAAGALRPASWSRPGCRTIRCSMPSRSASPHRCWPRRPRCAGWRRCRRSSPWPFSLALLAPAYAESFGQAAGGASVSVSALAEDRFLLRAPDHETLCDLLAGVPRPSGRGLRVEVDPVTV